MHQRLRPAPPEVRLDRPDGPSATDATRFRGVPPSTGPFEALTTLSNGISRPGDLGSRVCCLGIAILGQLYVAMLFGLILGRFHQTMRR